MRKVALITDGWRRLFTYAWPAGILQRIRETGEDVNLYIFNSTGNWSRDAGYIFTICRSCPILMELFWN